MHSACAHLELVYLLQVWSYRQRMGGCAVLLLLWHKISAKSALEACQCCNRVLFETLPAVVVAVRLSYTTRALRHLYM